jgi:hypothetical protein
MDDSTRGLTEREADERRRADGPNVLPSLRSKVLVDALTKRIRRRAA